MKTRQKLRNVVVASIVVAAAGAGTLATAGPASAATGKNGVLELGELGLYYNSNLGGAIFDLYSADVNFIGEHFPKARGTLVDNNTASYHNMDSYDWHGFTGTFGDGYLTNLWSGSYLNILPPYKNAISSAYWYMPN